MNQKYDTESFIEKAIKIHGDKYDYSKVEYINYNTKVCVICPIHGEFWITPSNHLNKTKPRSCPKCAHPCYRKTTDEYVKEAISKHGDKYDYSKTKYVNNTTKVCVICPIHGEFWVNPEKHIHRGDGCPLCSYRTSYTTESFIEKVKTIHHDEYDYSKIEYVNSKTKVCVICPTHGEFWISTSKLLIGQGCPKCRYIKSANKKRRSLGNIITLANNIHDNKYDYSLIQEYKNDTIKYPIICPIHGIFEQNFLNHLKGQGCPICGQLKSIENRTYTNEEYIEKAKIKHNNKYDYSKTNYISSKEKITIICPTHGEFEQMPNNHLYGQGCPKCNDSHLERQIEQLLINNDIMFEREKTFEWLLYKRHLYLDFYLPQYNVAIECQGKQHFINEGFGNYEEITKRDYIKKELCNLNNVNLLYFSNLNITYPYEVITTEKELLEKIINGNGKTIK